MCGIWALLSRTKLEGLGKLFEAFMKIKNRGPEYSSFDLVNDRSLLGFHRLAIMDLSAEGNQPFHHVRPDGSCVYCICNGEIYDYKKLKLKYNIETKSSSDCEVIIPLYEKLGVDGMIRLLGSEFCFVILDIDKDGNEIKMFAGRDPIGVRPSFYGLNEDSICISSELKGLTDLYERCYVFPPGHYMRYDSINPHPQPQFIQYYSYVYDEISPLSDIQEIYTEIRKRFINSVRKRMATDRPFGALLSGGLDSSLVCGVMKYLIDTEFPELKSRKIPVFTIVFRSGSSDLPYAKEVAEYLGFEHHIIEVDEEDGLRELDQITNIIECWDITTNRCSILQHLVAKYIKENTQVRVLFCGENSDECHAGYAYFHNAPSTTDAKNEAIRLVKNVHTSDGLRTDRTMAHSGLEVRIPFADPEFVDYLLSLPPNLVAPIDGLEKHTLRHAFKDMKLIPESALMRHKCAFSDSVSKIERSWFQIIQEYVEKIVDEDEYQREKDKFKHCPPFTKESYYYRKKFVEHFGESEEVSKVTPYFWMPKWTPNVQDPSARVLQNYKE